jgi:hypothetical protein
MASHPVGDHVVVLDDQDSSHGTYDRPEGGFFRVSDW